MRTYKHKNKKRKTVIRKEILTPYMGMHELKEHMKKDITEFESIQDKQKLVKIAKEERKRTNRLEYELEKKEKLQEAQETNHK